MFRLFSNQDRVSIKEIELLPPPADLVLRSGAMETPPLRADMNSNKDPNSDPERSIRGQNSDIDREHSRRGPNSDIDRDR